MKNVRKPFACTATTERIIECKKKNQAKKIVKLVVMEKTVNYRLNYLSSGVEILYILTGLSYIQGKWLQIAKQSCKE